MSTGAVSAATAIPFPFATPQFATLAAGPLAGQQVLCVPDSMFVDKNMDGEWVKRFAMTDWVTHEQFGRFAASVQGKVFFRDKRDRGIAAVGEDYRDAIARGMRVAFEREINSEDPTSHDVMEGALRTLLDPAVQTFPLPEGKVLEVGPFYLFEIPPFSYPAGQEEEPALVQFLYALAYADSLGGDLPTIAQTAFARRAAADLLKPRDGDEWPAEGLPSLPAMDVRAPFSVALRVDPLRLLHLLPFAFDRSTLPLLEVFLDDVLDGYHGILYGAAKGPAIVGEDGVTVHRLSKELQLREKWGRAPVITFQANSKRM